MGTISAKTLVAMKGLLEQFQGQPVIEKTRKQRREWNKLTERDPEPAWKKIRREQQYA